MTTQQKRPRPKATERLSRTGAILEWRADVFLMHQRFRHDGSIERNKCSISLKIEGEFTEPVKKVTRFSLLIDPLTDPEFCEFPNAVPSVGLFLSANPVLKGCVSVLEPEFTTLLTLAAAGRLAHCLIDFEAPYYGKSRINGISFSTAH